ncbi:MAG: HypC/HybG/HupF family hydrogenase formation chaperone [Anaerolineales bacterium]
MCISIPGQIVEIIDPVHRLAHVEISGQKRMVNLGLLSPNEGMVGEWVLVQAGLAVQRISPDEAHSALEFLRELDQLYEEAKS